MLTIRCKLHLIIALLIIVSGLAYQNVYVKYVKCNPSMDFYFPNFTCYAKSINRTCSTITFLYESILPISFVYMQAAISYKYGTIYRQVLDIKRFEYCGLMLRGTKNLVTNFLINIIKESAPAFVQPCPHKLINVSQAPMSVTSVTSPFATGDYKINLSLTNEYEKRMFTILVVFSVNSSDKNSFG